MATVAERIGGDAWTYAVHTKGQAYPMHEPRLKRGLAIGYAVSPTGADHCHSLHDTGLVFANEEGFLAGAGMRQLGVLEPIALEDLGPAKVKAFMLNSMSSILPNCLTMCTFPGWSLSDLTKMVRAATGFDVTEYELMKVGERAMNLARVFNMREGWTAEDDHLAPRSYQPTTGGALSDGGIDPEELTEAVHVYYGMMGWDPETGAPLDGKLQELDIAWAAEQLPGRVPVR